jgi:hypothetical protein
MIYAVINNQTNIVENTVVLNEGAVWSPPEGYYIVDITGTEVGNDWIYNPQTNEWTPPPNPEPSIEETSGSAPNVIE